MFELLFHRIFGIAPEGQERLRVGGGVVNHTSYVMLALCAAIGVISWALREAVPLVLLGVIGILAFVVIFFLCRTWFFAHLHPDLAATGGSEWRRFREAQLASKNQPEMLTLPSSSDPTKPLPANQKRLDPPDAE